MLAEGREEKYEISYKLLVFCYPPGFVYRFLKRTKLGEGLGPERTFAQIGSVNTCADLPLEVEECRDRRWKLK